MNNSSGRERNKLRLENLYLKKKLNSILGADQLSRNEAKVWKEKASALEARLEQLENDCGFYQRCWAGLLNTVPDGQRTENIQENLSGLNSGSKKTKVIPMALFL